MLEKQFPGVPESSGSALEDGLGRLGASGEFKAAPRRPRERLGGNLDCLGGVLGLLGAVLEPSGAALEPSGAALGVRGRSW